MFHEQDGITTVLLRLGPCGSSFFVFRARPAPCTPAVARPRDGEEICSAVAPTTKIIVEKAVYGVPGDPQRTRDVREKVQQKVDGGESSFRVTDMAVGDDPAHQVVKTLVVDYVVEETRKMGQGPSSVPSSARRTVKAQDGDAIHVTPNAVQITVE